MSRETHQYYLSIALRVSAIIFWVLALTILATIAMVVFLNPLVKEGSFFGNLLVRYPYRWDFEMMFAGIYLVWGIFLWSAARNPSAHLSFIDFTIWANAVHGIIMVGQGFFRETELLHLAGDSIILIGVALVLSFLRYR